MEKSSVKSVRNLECKDFVMFPRTQLKGIDFEEVEKELFSAECKHIEGQGDFWIVTQKDYPRMVFQVFLPKSMEQFDDYLGKLLGMHATPAYISGHYDFLVLFQGANDHIPLTQANHKEVYASICKTEDKAACWWYMYGKEHLSIK